MLFKIDVRYEYGEKNVNESYSFFHILFLEVSKYIQLVFKEE